jgi:hypothetical protein
MNRASASWAAPVLWRFQTRNAIEKRQWKTWRRQAWFMVFILQFKTPGRGGSLRKIDEHFLRSCRNGDFDGLAARPPNADVRWLRACAQDRHRAVARKIS